MLNIFHLPPFVTLVTVLRAEQCAFTWNKFLTNLSCQSSEWIKTKVCDQDQVCCIFAGPKRGRPTWGFPVFARTSVRPYVRTSVRPYVRPYVRTYVSTLDFSFILHAKFTSNPQYFYRFRQTWKMSETLPEQDCLFPDFTRKCEN